MDMPKPDVYDGLIKLKNLQDAKTSEAFEKLAKEYANQGFDKPIVAELLEADGCPRDISKQLAESALEKLPNSYNYSDPPETYQDIKETVEKTLASVPEEKLRKYFETITNNKSPDLVNHILMARNNNSSQWGIEVNEKLREITEDIMLTNKTAALSTPLQLDMSEKETLEQELFGIWPAYLIQKKAHNTKAIERLIGKSKPEDFKDPTPTFE